MNLSNENVMLMFTLSIMHGLLYADEVLGITMYVSYFIYINIYGLIDFLH